MAKYNISMIQTCYYVVCMLYSLHAYMFWHVSNSIITIAIFAMTIGIHALFYKCYRYNNINIAFFAILAVLLGTRGNFNGYLFNVINLFPFLSYLFLKDEYKYAIFYYWRKVFLAIISISLICYIVISVGVELPYLTDFYGDDTLEGHFYLAKNYVVLIQLYNQFTNVDLQRFQSIFLEPGYLACLIVMMLFIDEFNFKKHKSNFVLLVSLILTFSIAGYLLFIFFYIIRTMKNTKNKSLAIMGLLVLIGGIYLYGTYYNGGDNLIETQVLERLKYDEQRGTLEGYNRTTESFDSYFNDFLFSEKVLTGDPQNYNRLFSDSGANVGIKYYIVMYGIIGLLAYCLFLYSPFWGMIKKKSYISLSFMLLWFIIFARGNYVMWMTAFLITYIFGLRAITDKQNI